MPTIAITDNTAVRAMNWMLCGTPAAATELLRAVHADRAAARQRPLDDAFVDADFLWEEDHPTVRIVSPAAGAIFELSPFHYTLAEL